MAVVSQIQVVIGALAAVITVVSALFMLGWWLSGQFGLVRTLVYEIKGKSDDKIENVRESILAKFDEHEHEDNERFDRITTALVRLETKQDLSHYE